MCYGCRLRSATCWDELSLSQMLHSVKRRTQPDYSLIIVIFMHKLSGAIVNDNNSYDTIQARFSTLRMCSSNMWVFYVAVFLPSLCFSSCSDGGPPCKGGGTSWLGPEEGLLYKISNKCQQDVIQPSDGVFFTIKTTFKYHSTRLPPILYTWLQTVSPSQVCFSRALIWVHCIYSHMSQPFLGACKEGGGSGDISQQCL